MGKRRRLLLAAAAVAAVGLLSAAPTSAALSLEQRCIAAGLVMPVEWHGYAFNHHPEKDREVRATDNYLAPFEVASEFDAVIADLPADCRGSYARFGQIKLQFKSTRGGRAWRSIRKGWEELQWGARYLDPPKPTAVEHTVTETSGEPPPPLPPEYAVEEEGSYGTTTRTIREYSSPDPPPSPFVSIRSVQNMGALGLGCATASRARIKLWIADEATKAIVAVRFLNIPTPVDSWFQARCLGRFSIQESAAARRCGKRVVGAGPGGPPTLWGVKVQRVGCAPAAAVAHEALRVPAFSQGSLAAHEVAGWRCYFGHRGAMACLQGDKRIYLVAREAVREKCEAAPRGVKSLSVANSSCDVAGALAAEIQQDPDKELLEARQTGGASWSCPAIRYLDSDDRLVVSYHCFAGEAMAAFRVTAPGRVAPAEPASIPPEAILPGSGPAALFALTPEMTFGERAKWTRTKAFLPVEVEPALVGQRARLELVEFKAECSWTADAGQTSPICPSSKRVGASRRTIVLKPSQMLYLAPRKRRGNWLYRLTIETPPFAYGGLSYRRTSHALSASVINEADNCEVNPWCKPDKKKGGKKGRGGGGRPAGRVLQLR